jgi:ribosomal protein S18 acetylase RimI-like enzyme
MVCAMTALRIRRLTPADAAAYQAIRLRAVKEHPKAFLVSHAEERKHSLAEVRRRLGPGVNSILGAFLGSTLVGTIGVVRESYAKTRHKGLIWGMYVAPDARARGLGRRLLDAAFRRFSAMRGVEQVTLAVATTNTAARSLYLSAGFRVFSLERRAMKLGRVYIDEETMVRRLRSR